LRIAIHQPEFLPWPGFFNKMFLADLFVIFDHVQFKKRYFENRNRIVSPRGETAWVGVPVKSKGKFTQAIKDVEIDNSQLWKNKLLTTVGHYYGRAPFFGDYFPGLKALIEEREYGRLIDLNMELISFFRRNLGIATRMEFSSGMGVEDFRASDLILNICRKNGAGEYLCGSSGKDYLKEEDFEKNGIGITWLDYKPPVYGQLCGEFKAGMSTLDILFNHGGNSLEILTGNITTGS